MRGLAVIDVIFAAALAVKGLVCDAMSADEDVLAEAHFGVGGRHRGNGKGH